MTPRPLPDPTEPAVCYSGFREGQSPDAAVFPSEAQVREDLRILQDHFRHLRMYDGDAHAETALAVIEADGLDLTVMLGAYVAAEVSNPSCPWGGEYDAQTLADHRRQNEARVERLVALANRYPRVISSVSVGNEATVQWTDHLVPVERVVELARTARAGVAQPVTYCENYVPWLDVLAPLAEVVDFISVHTYPVWEYKSVSEALAYTIENLDGVSRRYPDKPIVITEAGWTTRSNGRGIPPEHVGEAEQAEYLRALTGWAKARGILTYLFEAFNEPWKGSPDPAEPEKHWGLYFEDRRPKRVMREGVIPRRAGARPS